jgi:protein TonB
VLAALNRHRQYPAAARARRQQGVPWIRFTIDRQGNVANVRLERTSGREKGRRDRTGGARRVFHESVSSGFEPSVTETLHG